MIANIRLQLVPALSALDQPPQVEVGREIVVGSTWRNNENSVFTVTELSKGNVTCSVPADESWMFPTYTFTEKTFRKTFTHVSD